MNKVKVSSTEQSGRVILEYDTLAVNQTPRYKITVSNSAGHELHTCEGNRMRSIYFNLPSKENLPDGKIIVTVEKKEKPDDSTWSTLIDKEVCDLSFYQVPPKPSWSERIKNKKILLPLTAIAIAAAVIGCAKLSGCNLSLAVKTKQGGPPTKPAPPTTQDEKPAGVVDTKPKPPATGPTDTLVDKVLAGLRSPAPTEPLPATLAETKGVSVTNAVAGNTTIVNVNGGTVNGGINVYNGTVYQGSSSGKKTTVSPGDVTEDTFRKVTPGMPSIILEPGEIAYIDFRAGLKNFKFTYDEDRKSDVRALYDGQPLSSKHDPENTQWVTIENTGGKPLKLDFSGW